jgi:5'-3' exoribonuclease 1
MEYIRYLRSSSTYNPNTRHCLYGLDADLIILGLSVHEPHFSLLREEIKFNKFQNRFFNIDESKFCLLHLSLMREYLELEFSPIKSKLSFEFDVENIIDDWILLTFLIGNDFIPPLPNLHIQNNALMYLITVYMEVLQTIDGKL